MTDIEGAIFFKVTSITAVATIIAARFFPGVAPSSAPLPYGTYQRISGEPDHHLLSASGLRMALFQISSVSTSGIEAFKLGEALRLGMDGFRGDIQGVDVRSVQLRDERETTENPTDASQDTIFRVIQDWSFIHREPFTVFA